MNLQALATRLGVSTKTTASWARKGCPHTRSKTGTYAFNLKQVTQWREQTLAPRPSTAAGPTSYYAARARKEVALAELRELQLRVRKGELVLKSAVEKVMFDRARRARDRMENIPARTSGICASETSQEKIFALLTKEIRDALEELSNDQSTTSSAE